jgi:hypothetical protein
MSANPHSVVHARQFADVEKSKDEQPRKSEPGVKGVVSLLDRRQSFFGSLLSPFRLQLHSAVLSVCPTMSGGRWLVVLLVM